VQPHHLVRPKLFFVQIEVALFQTKKALAGISEWTKPHGDLVYELLICCYPALLLCFPVYGIAFGMSLLLFENMS